MMASAAAGSSKGYPLIALFLLLTTSGIIAGLLAPVARALSAGELAQNDLIIAVIAGSGIVMVVGGIVGLFHYRRARGVAWGLLTGAMLGAFAGPVALVPRDDFGAVLGMCLGGAAVVILMSAAFRLSSRS